MAILRELIRIPARLVAVPPSRDRHIRFVVQAKPSGARAPVAALAVEAIGDAILSGLVRLAPIREPGCQLIGGPYRWSEIPALVT